MKIRNLLLKTKNDEIPWALFVPDKSGEEYAVMWLQGWMSSIESHQESVKRMAEQTGTAFAMLDYAGHGKHKLPLEQSTHKQQLDEVIAIYDELKQLGYNKIIAIGGSFGGYMASLLSVQRPVQAIILRAPANYPDDEIELPYGQTQTQKRRPTLESSATQAIGEFDGFVYVLEHELDEMVPREILKRYFEAARKGNYLIIPRTKHSPKLMKDPQRHYKYIELILITLVEAIKQQDTLG